MKIDVEIEGTVSQTVRAKQLAAAFDVPMRDREQLSWHGDMPIETRDWNVGLIVGPSGSGKTTIMRRLWGTPSTLRWKGDAVVDDFPASLSIEDVTGACMAVGFNTIPAWLRPYKVLSGGEQFRVSLARTLVEADLDKPIVMDEFTSVVDRQVAQIGAHAAQKWVRRHERQFVAVTCHYDVIDWLQPDWVFDPSTMLFEWRHLQRRPALDCTITRVPYSFWPKFAPFHYLTAELNRSAQCFCLFAGPNQDPTSFIGVIHRPMGRNSKRPIKGMSRGVTLPDWQGLGLIFALIDRVASAYRGLGYEYHAYPAHPTLIRSMDRSPAWELLHKPGHMVSSSGRMSKRRPDRDTGAGAGKGKPWRQGSRPCAIFRYRGDPLDPAVAGALIDGLGSSKPRKRVRVRV